MKMIEGGSLIRRFSLVVILAPTEDVIRRVNEVARGRVGYFRFGNCTKAMSSLRYYLGYRMRI
jgi:hypothetical protein